MLEIGHASELFAGSQFCRRFDRRFICNRAKTAESIENLKRESRGIYSSMAESSLRHPLTNRNSGREKMTQSRGGTEPQRERQVIKIHAVEIVRVCTVSMINLSHVYS